MHIQKIILRCSLLVIAALLISTAAGSVRVVSAQSESTPSQLLTTTDSSSLSVDSQVSENLNAQGKSNFWIVLRKSADYSSMPALPSKNQRGAFVYHSLTTIAADSQSRILAYLKTQGLKYNSHWIVNSILVYNATAVELRSLESFPEVLAIKGQTSIEVENEPQSHPAETTVSTTPVVNWGLSFTHADEVWSTFNDRGAGIVVANIDTGVDVSHPALVNQYRGTVTGSNNYNWYAPLSGGEAAPCTDAAKAPCDANGHGTHTMGIIVGQDGDNETGMAPQAEWIACMGCNSTSCSDADLIGCAEWVLAPTDLSGQNPDSSKAPDIVNNSWGGGTGNNWYENYVQAWVAAGIFPSFSAGNKSTKNSDCGNVTSPGDYTESFASGAVDSTGEIASFSSHGPGSFSGNLKPDLVAPGVNIISTYNDGGYHLDSGTSMAAPHTSGAVALLWSEVPSLKNNVAETINLLYGSANSSVPADNQCGTPVTTKTPNNTYGYGYLDTFSLVENGLGFFKYKIIFPLIMQDFSW